jgi:MFS family permease
MNFLASERAVAPPGFNRWLIPPAVLAVHLSIGQVYALSIFYEPLTRLIGVTAAAPQDWTLDVLTPLFVVAISVLGLATTVGARWIDRVGPQSAMFVAACCFGGGLMVAAFGVFTHQLWLVYGGYGVLGGIGLGLGYVAPVSTLIRWFPDRRGLASGMAIMGFGGGAMIATPLSRTLLELFSTSTSVGMTGTLVAMGVLYFIAMSVGAFSIRVPASGWHPDGMAEGDLPPAAVSAGRSTKHAVAAREAMKTPQFYFLWVLLCMNVTSGIELLAHAPEMIIGTFAGAITTAAAAGFVGLLGLFNMAGRLLWSIASDVVGRKTTYAVLLFLGVLFYAGIPWVGPLSVTLFVVLFVLAVSIYGGCFAMIPAYITDLFGSRDLTCIHGRLLSAWSVGVVLSFLLDRMRVDHLSDGISLSEMGVEVLYLPAVLLLVGLISNLLIRPVSPEHFTPPMRAGDATRANIVERPAREHAL